MARVHKWYFLTNQAGEPVAGASVYITLAGTGGKDEGTPAWIFYDEFGTGGSRDMPQITTLENGYFEFWVEEDSEFDLCDYKIDYDTTQLYPFNQKFRIDWDKPNVHSGYVDFVDIFPVNRYLEEADFEDCADPNVADNRKMNKTVSNYLVCRWQKHVDLNILETLNIGDVHGLALLDTTEPNDLVNKIVTNNQGWLWDIHEASTVHEFALSGFWELGGQQITHPPHDLRPLNTADTSPDQWSKWNKVVSNEYMAGIEDELDAIKFQVFTIDEAGAPSPYDFEWDWNIATERYEALVGHGLGISWPDVICWGLVDVSEDNEPADFKWMLVKTADIERVDEFNLRVSIAQEPFRMKVRVTT